MHLFKDIKLQWRGPEKKTNHLAPWARSFAQCCHPSSYSNSHNNSISLLHLTYENIETQWGYTTCSRCLCQNWDSCPVALEHTGTLPLLNPVLLLEISLFVVASLRTVWWFQLSTSFSINQKHAVVLRLNKLVYDHPKQSRAWLVFEWEIQQSLVASVGAKHPNGERERLSWLCPGQSTADLGHYTLEGQPQTEVSREQGSQKETPSGNSWKTCGHSTMRKDIETPLGLNEACPAEIGTNLLLWRAS